MNSVTVHKTGIASELLMEKAMATTTGEVSG